MNLIKKFFKNKKGSGLVEKIMITAFAVAAGGAVIVYTSNVVIEAKNHNVPGLSLTEGGTAGMIPESSGTDGLIYTLNGNTYSVTGYEGSATNVVIPSTYNGKNVTDIGNSAFENNRNITSVNIGYNVTRIGEQTFRLCSAMTSVSIPSSVTVLSRSAFASSGLVSVTIPDSVTSVENYAFNGCKSLQSITFGEGVTTIGGWVCEFNSALRTVNLGGHVTSIGQRAFLSCGITSFTFNNTVSAWNSVSKGSNYAYNNSFTYVQCTDGNGSK